MVAGTLTYNTKMDTKGLQEGANKFGTSIKNIVAGLGIDRIISGAFNMINSSLDGAISRLDTLNNFPKVMSNLGIDAESSQKAIDDLSERIKGIPTTLDDAAMAVERFTSKNGDVQESVEIFDAVNNAILAGGAGADIQKSALEQLSQAYSKGKPDMMEWRTLQMAMPAQLNQVAKAMGTTTDKLGENLRNGKVSMDDFIDTFIQLNKEGIDGFESFEKQAKNSTGGIKTSITNMKTAVTRGVADIVQSLNEGLKKSGFENGLGDIFSNIGKFAESALKKVGEIVKNILPPIIDFIRNTIDKIKTKWQELNMQQTLQNLWKIAKQVFTSILNAIKPVWEFVKNKIIPIFKNLFKSIKEKIDTTNFDELKKTLEGLEPIITAVISGFLAFKAVQTIVGVVKAVKAAFVALKTTLSSLTITGVIGLVIAALTAVIVAAKAFGEKATEEFRNTDEEMRRHVTSIGKAFDEYGDKIQNATGKMSSFNRELFITSEKDQEIKDEMSQIQQNITDIAYNAHEERRSLSQEEIDKVEEYLQKLEELSGKYYEVTQMQGEAIVSQALTKFDSLKEEGFDKFSEEYVDWAKTVEDYESDATQSAKDYTTQRIALLDAEWQGRDKNTEQYKQEYNQIVKAGDDKIDAVKGTVKKVVEAAENELQQKMNINQQDLDNVTDMLEKRKGIYEEGLKKQHSVWMSDRFKLVKLWNDNKDTIEKNNKEITRIMGDENAEQLGIWAKSLEESAKYGGEISEQDLKMAKSILNIYDSLNDDSKSKMKDMYDSLTKIVKEKAPELVDETKNVADNVSSQFDRWYQDGYDKGTNFMDGILSGLQVRRKAVETMANLVASGALNNVSSTWEEHSPSKATRRLAEYFDEGIIQGINNKRQAVMNAVKGLGNEVLDQMSNAVNVESGKINAQAMLSSNINRTIQINASFNGDVELDNRRVGKIIAPDVSRAIKAGGL